MNNYTDLYINNPVYTSAQEVMRVVKMLASDGYETRWYPVDVINVKGQVIGVANSKEEFIKIWNSNGENQLVATLMGSQSDFAFTAIVFLNKTLDRVIGNARFELMDSDGVVITDFDNSIILYQ